MAQKEYSQKVMIKKIVDFFQMKQFTGDEKSLERWVIVPDVNRPGFELAGYFHKTEPRRIVIIGNKEMEYISHMSEEDQRARYPMITDGLTPMIVITNNNTCPPILKEIAEKENFPIFGTSQTTSRFAVDLVSYLDETLAEEDTVSGSLLVVYGKGVLLTGESGIGKSETALELIRSGHVLVSDDRVDVQRIHNHIHGHAPMLIEGKLEMRGIGIIDVRRMYGASCLKARNRIEMVIHLSHYNENHEYERIGDTKEEYTEILGVQIPTVELPVSPGRSTRIMVESAVTNQILKEQGYHSSKEFRDQLLEYLEEENKKRGL
ncbi:MAG: HPr(Ser) kinase/phosphatase [Solobacterium sp.]|nr:HPr(Ser) kinase/phosphatase [Solobacterium sp.]